MPSQGQPKRRATLETEKPTKRTRVSRACDQCRLAREKCDGIQPTCSTCSIARRGCTYTANVKKRGIQPGYIRALELALAYLFQHEPQNESLVNEKLAHGGSTSLLLSRDSKESNKLHKRWRKTRFYTDVDRLLSGGEPPRHDQSEPLSPDSDDENSDVEHGTAMAVSTLPIPSGKTMSEASSSRYQQVSVRVPPSRLKVAHQSMPLESWKLLETYFNYTQCWFPICEKHDVLKLSYSYPAEGLELSSDRPDSGSHAELWSVLALASLHGADTGTSMSTQEQLYATARSLVPEERGPFDLGHVKALLNMAIFNMTQSLSMAARILIGLAYRLLEACDEASVAESPRYKHTRYGCYVLDNMLALQLGSQPLSTCFSLERFGPIDEDGLDEWQPWAGSSDPTARQMARTPLLALSSFNALLSIIGIMTSPTRQSQDSAQLLEIWKAGLPLKLSYIREEHAVAPLTPPAILLQTTYDCATFLCSPSSKRLLRLLDLLERARDELGLSSLPPVVVCLIDSITQFSRSVDMDRAIQQRLGSLRAALSEAWPRITREKPNTMQKLTTSNTTPFVPAFQVPTPHSTVDQSLLGDNINSIISPFDPSLSHLYNTTTPIQTSSSLRGTPVATYLDPKFPEVSTDLESFFDELASLDNTNNLDNQPQFMQNLGFAPDANMADLFSEYIPLQSSAFMLQPDPAGLTIEQTDFYDGN